MSGVDVLAVWDEAIRRTEAAMPTPLGNHGESAMHPVHHAGLVFDMAQARAAVATLIAADKEYDAAEVAHIEAMTNASFDECGGWGGVADAAWIRLGKATNCRATALANIGPQA